MATTNLPLTAAMARDQRAARRSGLEMQERANHGETLLEVQDGLRDPGYVIYVYNILNRDHWVHQTGFPNFYIPACEKGEKFSFTTLPAYTREMYLKPGSTEYMYKMIDGRRAATSLLNPAAFPGVNFDSQLGQWRNDDQQGNNLNLYGVFWSLTQPQDPKLEREIKLFRDIANKTMQGLVQAAEILAAQNDVKNISPLMHFAMDYLGKSAPWHMAMYHMVSCPNCGEMVREGIAYHKNAFGEKCIIDPERYAKVIEMAKPPAPPEPPPAAPTIVPPPQQVSESVDEAPAVATSGFSTDEAIREPEADAPSEKPKPKNGPRR